MGVTKGFLLKLKRKINKPVLIGVFVFILMIFLFFAAAFTAIFAQKVLPQNVQISLIQNFPALQSLVRVTKVTDVFDIFDLLRNSKNPIYELEIPNKNLDKLAEDYRDYVKAEFNFDGKKYKVKVRNKGYDPKHYEYAKKSWTVKFEDEELFLEKYKKIALTIPSDRRFLVEEFNNYRASKLGLSPPDSWFANLEINGKGSGLYFVTQYFDGNYLALNRKIDSANLYASDFDTPGMPFEGVKAWKKYSNEDVLGIDNFADIEKLLSIFDESEEDFNKYIFDILNEDNFYNWQIHSLLSKSFQQDNYHNLRAFFDPSRGKFEFIPWDVLIGTPDPRVDFDYNPLVTKILSNPLFLHERNLRLWDYVSDPKNLKDDLEHFDELDELTEVDFNKDRGKLMSNSAVQNYNDLYRGYIEQIFNYIRDAFEQIHATLKVDLRGAPFLGLNLSSFAAQKIDDLSVTVPDSVKPHGISLYYDVNGNSIFDGGDRFLSSANYSEDAQAHVFSDIDLLLHSNRVVHKTPESSRATMEKDPLLTDSTLHGFFLVSDVSLLGVSDVELSLKNHFTEELYEPMVQLVNSDSFDDFYKIGLSQDEFLRSNP